MASSSNESFKSMSSNSRSTFNNFIVSKLNIFLDDHSTRRPGPITTPNMELMQLCKILKDGKHSVSTKIHKYIGL
jgi:hypothetical protein